MLSSFIACTPHACSVGRGMDAEVFFRAESNQSISPTWVFSKQSMHFTSLQVRYKNPVTALPFLTSFANTMAQGIHAPIVPIFLAAMIILLFSVTPTSGLGFSLKLIHRDLHHTPSQVRISNVSLATMRPIVWRRESLYMVGLSVGTGAGTRSYQLLLDTGTPFTWLQCKPCRDCYLQPEPRFDPTRSPTFQHVAHNDPFCRSPLSRTDGRCTYRQTYSDRLSISGAVARDTFTFMTPNEGSEHVPNLVFGCTHETRSQFRVGPAGVFAMSDHPLSSAAQLANLTDGRFSYCLFPPAPGATSYLRFGDDIRINRSQAQRTPLLRQPESGCLWLNMQGISINDVRLGISNAVFIRHPNGTGGVALVTGLARSRLIRSAYNALRQALEHYFRSNYNLRPINGSRYDLDSDLCYEMPRSSSAVNLPSMTLHFQQADLRILQKQLFYGRAVSNATKAFCLAVDADERRSVLGAFQQHNTRFMVDIQRSEVWFAQEDCAHEGHL